MQRRPEPGEVVGVGVGTGAGDIEFGEAVAHLMVLVQYQSADIGHG
jgi:hypothetical protein